MKTLSRNKRKLYYRNFVSSSATTDVNGLETGEYTSVYGEWTELNVNYSAGTNNIQLNEYGNNSNSSRQITFAKGECALTETSQIYIGSETPTSATSPNYYVSGIMDSLNVTLVTIKEVDVK